ncbi:MAG: hypothetical protein AAF442_01620 [Pseudomonadota bacterium]
MPDQSRRRVLRAFVNGFALTVLLGGLSGCGKKIDGLRRPYEDAPDNDVRAGGGYRQRTYPPQ